MTILRNITVAATMALAGSQALAADLSGPLAPGKPAGVHEAQNGSPNLLVVAGVSALVVAGVVIAVANGDDSTPPTSPPTTTTTGTSG